MTDVRAGSAAVTCTPPGTPAKYAGCSVGRTAQSRLGAGDLVLQTRGAVLRGTIRTHLHNATIRASVVTSVGAVEVELLVHARRQLVVLGGHGRGGEAAALVWQFHAAPAIPPSMGLKGAEAFAAPEPDYELNPPPNCTSNGCVQRLLFSSDGRGWATLWRSELKSGSLLVALTADLPRPATLLKTVRAAAEAAGALDAAEQLGMAALTAEHTGWWAAFYERGAFLTLPPAAARVEQFHWIQAYKVGSENACRRFRDSAAAAGFLDNCVLLDGINGPLSLSKTKWTGAIWDMNVEGSQWTSLGINAMEQTQALVERIPEQTLNFIASVPKAFRNDSAAISGGTGSMQYVAACAVEYCEFPLCLNASNVPDLGCLTQPEPAGAKQFASFFGGLPWICHSIWLVYRHSMDEAVLLKLAPLLQRATTMYLRTAIREKDGKLHLPSMFSPEYAVASVLITRCSSGACARFSPSARAC